jgi:transposase
LGKTAEGETMRGENTQQNGMFSYISPDRRVPQKHPLRWIKKQADEVLKELSPVFDDCYSEIGRPSIPPEQLLKSMLLIALYTVRSDRLFCEMLDYNILFRWFLDMDLDEKSFDATVFTKNRERLLEQEVTAKFLERVVRKAREEKLLSDEHFSVDGTLIEAWASMKSFKEKGKKDDKKPDDPGNPMVDFHGEKRGNTTHESTTDPECRLMRKGKGKEAKLCFGGHVLMENRNGLLVDLKISKATGRSEVEEALNLVRRQKRRGRKPQTVGGDKGFHQGKFVKGLRRFGISPHVAVRDGWRIQGLDERTTKKAGYRISQTIRKRIEEIFGWLKTIGGLRKSRFRGIERLEQYAQMAGAALNLLRMGRLLTAKT